MTNTTTTETIDYDAVKAKQQATWSSGDYAVDRHHVADRRRDRSARRSTCRPASSCSTSPPATATRRSPQPAAAAEVTASDYVGALLDGTAARAAAEGLQIECREADAEALPFADDSFDVVLSTFGMMFTPHQEQTAHELRRVCRPGGQIGLANWTPSGFIGQMFKIVGRPRPAACRRALAAAVGDRGSPRRALRRPGRRHETRQFIFRYRVGAGLGRHVPHLLRPDAQGVRGARRGGSVRVRGRARRAGARRTTRRPTARCACRATTSRWSSPRR